MSAGGVQPSNPDPLRETTRYVKVADLSHGSFGFVQLARNTETQELVAIKFIERGDRVNRCVMPAVNDTQNIPCKQTAAGGAFGAVMQGSGPHVSVSATRRCPSCRFSAAAIFALQLFRKGLSA